MTGFRRGTGTCVRPGGGAVLVVVLLCLLFVNTVEAVGAGYKPRQLMAIMITKFPRYATWPAGGNGPNGKMVLCVATKDSSLKSEIAKMLNAKDIGGRKWEVKTVTSLADAKGYPLVFVGKDMEEPDDAWYDTVRRDGVMTFGEKSEGRSRSIINFVIVNKKVKFDLNLDSADKAGLKINSRLADVAREVIGKP